MMIVFNNILITFLIMLIFPSSLNAKTNSELAIFSPIALSHTAKVAIEDIEGLTLDKETNLKINEFTAYTNATKTHSLLIGPIFSEENLKTLCQRPDFLRNENIPTKKYSKLQFFHSPYEGCSFKIDSNRSVAVIKYPKPFTDLQGRKIAYIGMVTETNRLNKLLPKVTFTLSPKNFYISLLQIGSTYSPFASQINWKKIKGEGLNVIGDDKELCKGTFAAAKYLIPELYKIDHHTFITLNGLGKKSCPMPQAPKDPGIEKWLAVPQDIRKTIFEYSQNFHGKKYGEIAYLYIPAIEAYSPEKINEFVKLGREALIKSDIQHARALIVDLRFNTGGDVKSMLLTLGGVLPKGNLFGLDQSSFVSLSVDGNTLLVNGQPYGEFQGKKPFMARGVPVAILTNWLTASSAAITASSLRNGLPKSKLLGTPTSQSLSTNQTFFLWEGNTFNLMFERIYNAKGEALPLSLNVDEEIKDDFPKTFTDNDPVINAAKDWLAHK